MFIIVLAVVGILRLNVGTGVLDGPHNPRLIIKFNGRFRLRNQPQFAQRATSFGEANIVWPQVNFICPSGNIVCRSQRRIAENSTLPDFDEIFRKTRRQGLSRWRRTSVRRSVKRPQPTTYCGKFLRNHISSWNVLLITSSCLSLVSLLKLTA